MKIPNVPKPYMTVGLSLARIVSEDSQLKLMIMLSVTKSSKDS